LKESNSVKRSEIAEKWRRPAGLPAGSRGRGGAALFLLLFLVFLPAAAGAEDLLQAGDPAPLFQGVDLEGKPFDLGEELSRGPVFLVFWSIF
jgi:hypothetical protein